VPTPGMRCPWSWLSALRCSTRLCLAPLLAATASLASPPTPEPGSLSPVVAYDDLLGVAALGPDDVVTVGSWGRLARSRDGGASWQIRSVEAPATLLDVDFADDDHGWIVGEVGSRRRKASPARKIGSAGSAATTSRGWTMLSSRWGSAAADAAIRQPATARRHHPSVRIESEIM
jgi:hypothetical protein